MKEFKLKEEKIINEINSIGKLFEHKKTGGKIFCLENDDKNNLFSISFKTPPYDNTGIPHILEHSVLCGSKKFPVKDPFRELMLGSLNTFLNAITYPDKTMYPVSSQNKKDFFNLMNVYLDAVAYPKVREKKEIFGQEGWHYKLDEKTKELKYNGIVYNEMKGVFSNPEMILYRSISYYLYPDTPYFYESGGEPENIVKLTHENLIKFHEKYYHPSNSYIFFYGNIDTEKKLNYLENNYLKNYTKKKISALVPIQKPFLKPKKKTIKYAISKKEGLKNKTFLSLGFLIEKNTDEETTMAFEILTDILLNYEGSPLKESLNKQKLGKDISGYFETDCFQNFFLISIKNSNEESKENFKKIFFKTLKKLVKDGIDKDLILGVLNQTEFDLKEAEGGRFPKSLIYNKMVLNSWLYNSSPFKYLEFQKILDKIKKKIDKNYFESLIQKYLIDNKHYVFLTLKPDKDIAYKKEDEMKKHLSSLKKKLSEKDLEFIKKQNKSLKEWQEKSDSLKDTSTIPKLSIKDISTKPNLIPREEKNILNTKVLFHPIKTNDITYLQFFFNTKHIPLEKVQYLEFISTLFKKLNTDKYSYLQLTNLINKNTGGISFKTQRFYVEKDYKDYKTKFTIKGKCFNKDIDSLIHIIDEIVSNTNFDSKNRVYELLQQNISDLENKIFYSSDVMATRRLSSYFSEVGKYAELTTGIVYYNFLQDLEKNFDKKWSEILKNFNYLKKNVFNKNNLLINVTCDKKNYINVQKPLSNFLEKLEDISIRDIDYKIDMKNKNEGLAIQSNVQYVSKGYNFKMLGYEYNGHIKVLNNIISRKYLWDNIRLKGGAYGSRTELTRNGFAILTSYRDPNLKETLDVYDKLSDFLKNTKFTSEDIEKHIIGAMRNVDYPLSPFQSGEVSSYNYISGLSDDEIKKDREEILSTKPKDINKLSCLIEDVMKKNQYCVVGNSKRLEENSNLFYNIIDVIK